MKWLAGVLLAVVAQPAAPAEDRWAPGATAEPWPLIASLQRYAAASDPAPDWARAVRHEDPIVRAAAAAAIGRLPDDRRSADLALLLSDRVALVRQTAQWAALQQAGQPTAELALRILAEPWPQHVLLEGFLPRDKTDANVAREWLRGLPPGPLPAPAAVPDVPTPHRVAISALRSEYDADEVVDLAARVITGAGHVGATIRPPASVTPRDPWPFPRRAPGRRSGREPVEKPSVEVTIRVVGGDGTAAIPLVPATERAVTLALDLDELPPDGYQLTFGNPIFLRVRRSAAQEAQGLSLARDPAATDDALATVARLRVRAAAPALQRSFSQSLEAYGYGFNAWRATLALARVGDREAAGLVLPPLLRTKGFLDPYDSQQPDLGWLLTTAFDGEARGRLDAFASGWKDALDRGFDESLQRLLADPSYGPGTAIDGARLDVLAQLGGLYDTPVVADHRRRAVLDAAVAGAARDHPDAVAAVLARAASHHAMFAALLRPLIATLGPEAAEKLARALVTALPSTASDARAAVVAEAERLGATLPGAPAATVSAVEAERQLREALGPGSTPGALERAIARGRESLARGASPMVALLVADAELWRGCWQQAERVAPDPSTVPAVPHGYGRPHAHAVRGRIAAARGRLAEAARELAAAGALSNWAHQDLTKSLSERIAAAGPDAEGRVRFLPLAAAPGSARTFDTETAEELLRLAESGCAAPPIPAPPSTSDVLWSNGAVAVHKSGATSLYAWTTGFPPRPVWRSQSRYQYVVLQDEILELTDGELRRLDLATGRAIWAAPLSMSIERITVGGDLAVLLTREKAMIAYDLRDGRRLWTRELEGVVRVSADGIRYAVGLDGARVYLQNIGELLGLSAEDGRTLWTVPFAQDPTEAVDRPWEQTLVAVDSGSVWWLGELSKPGYYAAQRFVDRDGVVRLRPATTGDRRPALALRDGTLLVRPRRGDFLEVWDPR